ncbi:MAG: hypothetical protein V4670_05280 [Bacteroidota bacterium]
MKNNLKTVLFFSVLFFTAYSVSAQGCSDAGFCSVGNTFKDAQSEIKNSVEIGGVYGVGEEDVTIFSPYFIYTRSFTNSFAMSAKITSTIANGSFGTKSNVGDAFVTGNYKFNNSEFATSKWSGILGVKIPLTAGNDKINNFSLPMPYQSSLGTFDIIAGLDLAIKKWEFSTAVQMPLNKNKNSYLSELAPTDKFLSTNLLERKSDVLFRTTYKIKTENQKFIFRPNVLFIYHLGKDSFENTFGEREIIQKSDGLTINGNLIASYKLGDKSYIESSIATPFAVREVRPDGLTRAFTIGLSYKRNF